MTDMSFFESVNEVLEKQALDGSRDSSKMGAGAAASGQGQLWAEWHKMRPEHRARLLEEMLKVTMMMWLDLVIRVILSRRLE
jgi:hypothetical protein